MLHSKSQQKKRESIRIKLSVLHSLLHDIEALHQNIHDLAYSHYEQPTHLTSTKPTFYHSPQPPTPPHLHPWFAQTITPFTALPPRYPRGLNPTVHEYNDMRDAQYVVASPAHGEFSSQGSLGGHQGIFRRDFAGNFGAGGPHGTPRVTKTAPERRRKRKEKENKRRAKKVESESENENENENENESEEESTGDEGHGGIGDEGRGGAAEGRGGPSVFVEV